MARLKEVHGLLIDLEGTVYEAGQAVPGARETLEALSNLPHVFITNTTSRPRRRIVEELKEMGIPADPDRIFTAPLGARAYLLARGWKSCHLMVRSEVLEDFEGISPEDRAPQAVVVGDVGEDFTYGRMNRAFRLLLGGIPLVTLARNRYYRAADGLMLDQGPFVAALEHASGQAATLVGKPSAEFFQAALARLGLTASEVAVVGDDVEVDVGGGMALGMKGVLVRTGKFRDEELARSAVRPDAVIDSLAEIGTLF
jgi:HAD superfamily hydrolase (TIGR01458 family)